MRSRKMSQIGWALWGSWAVLLLVGCRSPHPQPENLDPIYLDLVARLDRAKKNIESEEKAGEEAQKAIALSEPRSPERKAAELDLKKARQQRAQAQQEAQFYEIQVKRRKLTARAHYYGAFERGLEWPDPTEGQAYKHYRSALESPRIYRPHGRMSD